MDKLDDKEIVAGMAAGDETCFAACLERYGSRIFSLSLRIVGNREDAEELTQDVFLKVYESAGSFRGQSAFSTWLYRIAYNRAISHVRLKVIVRPAADDSVLGNAVYETADDNRERRFLQVERALGRLSGKDRLLIELYYYQDKSVEELAYIVGQSVANIKVRLFRIRRKLQEYIGKEL